MPLSTVQLLLIVIVLGAVLVGAVFLIDRLTGPKIFPKYIPGLVFLLGAVLSVVRARWFSEGMQDLAFVLISMVLLGIGLLTLVTAVLIDVNRKISSL